MRVLRAAGLALVIGLLAGLTSIGTADAQTLNDDALWARAGAPLEPSPLGDGAQVFGTYANGCLSGAVALPLDGPGYLVIRPQRNRFWGHPRLIDFVQQMGHFATDSGIGALMIADLSQPRGGPISGHASHEVGLDVDIWLRLLPEPSLSEEERAAPQETSMLVPDGSAIDPNRWTDAHAALYRAAASHPHTARIFAHPLIKQQLCRTVTGDRDWLGRISPWYGHDAHLHVRLRCPPDNRFCRNQSPVAPGDGCGGALTWWLAQVPFRPAAPTGPAPTPPALPTQCAALAPR